MGPVAFYRLELPQPPTAVPELLSGYTTEVWTPSLFRPLPPGAGVYPYAVWFLFHLLGIFSSREYAAFVVRHQGLVAHRSSIFPRFFRFPFMAPTDLQVGDTWTHPDFRGRGLACFALKSIASVYAGRAPRVWYLTEEDNLASVRTVEKAGFQRAGRGEKTRRFGLGFFGSYVITEPASRV